MIGRKYLSAVAWLRITGSILLAVFFGLSVHVVQIGQQGLVSQSGLMALCLLAGFLGFTGFFILTAASEED